MRRIPVLFLAAVLFYVGMSRLGLTSETTDFLRTYRTAIDQMRVCFDEVTAEGILTETQETKEGSGPGKLERSRDSRFVYSTSRGRTRLTKIIDTEIKRGDQSVPYYVEFVYLNDSERTFLAKRPTKDGLFALVSRGGPDSRYEDSLRDDVNQFFRAYMSMGVRFIPDLLKMREFEIAEVSRVSREGRELTRVAFRYLPKGDPRQGFTGWWLLDPARKWVLEEFELRPNNKELNAVYRGSVTYAPVREGYPLPESVSLSTEQTLNLKDHHATHKQIALMKFSRFRREATPASDYSPAALGLADADFPPAPRPTGRRSGSSRSAWSRSCAALFSSSVEGGGQVDELGSINPSSQCAWNAANERCLRHGRTHSSTSCTIWLYTDRTLGHWRDYLDLDRSLLARGPVRARGRASRTVYQQSEANRFGVG